MNKNEYLRRINFEETDFEPTLSNLKILHKKHLLNVPFENLDIHWKQTILLDTNNFYEKIVSKKRGGFCYELNGLFHQLLQELGYRSRIISARVFNGKDFSSEYDHLAILTEAEGERFLVDVGFGDFIAEPLKFILDEEQQDATGTYKIRKYTNEYFEVVKKDADDWKSEYIFKDLNRDLTEFAGMCEFHQTSPESHFTRGKVCSLMTDNGRKTLTDKKFIKTHNGKRTEKEINSEDKFNEILKREFQVERNF